MRFISQAIIATAYFLFTNQSLKAAECSAKSGLSNVPLLELYTSEGCSSCPPADRWISSLKPDQKKVIPLAFHVDYWDYMGWKDIFAKSKYSDRQRKIANLNGASYVYTPQLLLNGHDFRLADEYHLNQSISINQKAPSKANLTLEASSLENGEILIKTSANAVNLEDSKNADIYVAIYENNLVSHVIAGENNGRDLKHDFVVRHLFGAFKLNTNNNFSQQFQLNREWKGKSAGAVIFIQDNNNGEVLQSLALPFCAK